MSLTKEIATLTDQISDKSKTAVIFEKKCGIVSSILRDVCDIILETKPDEKSHKQNLEILKENLQKILKTIEFLQNRDQLILFMLNDKAIQQFIIDINNSMEKVNLMMKKIGFDGSFKLPKDDLYDDYDKIDNFLMDVTNRFLRRRNEVEDYLKESQIQSMNESYATSNIDELNKNPKYKLKRSDFQYDDRQRYDYNNVFEYYEGTMEGKQVTVMRLKDSYLSIFKRLLNVLVTIDHPYVEKFIGANIENNKILIVTDRKGSNLAEVFEKQGQEDIVKLKPGDKTILAFKIAQAMSYLHSHGVVHRNLTPYNIFVNKKDKKIIPTIVGFRNSRFIPEENSIGMSNLNMKSKAPVSYFTAPELEDGKYNEKVDVFAFSGILYQMITGHIPYPKITRSEVISLLNQKENNRPELPENISKELKNFIGSCWSQDPLCRFSFDQIILNMINYKIVLPGDEEATDRIIAFYEKNQIKSDFTLKCLQAFSTIKNYIGKTFQYRFQFLRARHVLSNYECLLKESSYTKKSKLTQKQTDNLKKLYENLINFQAIALNNSEEKWMEEYEKVCMLLQNPITPKKTLSRKKKTDKIPDIKVIQPIIDITNSMESIYKSMISLGFTDIKEYKENDDDLVFDLRELAGYFPPGGYDYINKRADEIDEFREKRKLDEQVSNQATQRRLKDLFSQFKQFELDVNDFEDKGTNTSTYLNEGSTAKVHKLKYKNENVAVKVLSTYVNTGEIELGLLRREIGYLTKLKHPYISDFIGYLLLEENVVWLVSKYIENGTLEKMVNNGLLSGNDKTKIAYRIAQAMDYIHSHNIIHLDLKPGNILMDGKIPKIIDFGYSSSNNTAMNNKLGLGTIRYMAPEVYGKKTYNSKADVFSFALLLYHLYTEDFPFTDIDDDHNDEIGNKILNNEYGEYLEFNSDISNSLKKLIEEAWNFDPSKRPTFQGIINEMRNKYITFPGSDEAEMRAFYDAEIDKFTQSKFKLSH